MAYSLAGINLTVLNITNSLSQELDAWETPGENSSGTQIFGESGARRQITLEIIIVESSIANLKNKIDSIEALVDGASTGVGVSFVSDIHGTIKVGVESFNWQYAVTNKGNFGVSGTITLVEGDV